MKRKKRYKLKKGRITLTLIILISLITLGINTPDILEYIKLKSLDYSNNSIKLIKENNINIENYSKTLDKIITSEDFNKDNIKYYLDIKYQDKEDFFININKLIDIGYNAEDINAIYNKIDNIEIILNSDYNKNIINILNSDYYKKENIERYLKYESDNIVLDVNMYLDYEFYDHTIEIDNIDDLVIVNKYYKLAKDYEPELVKIDKKYAINDRQLLVSTAKEAFEKMCEDAKKEDIYLYSGSAYRSYNYQNTLYNNRVRTDGIDYADKTAARAGHSEHQTGLAIDILNKNYEYIDSDDEEYKWLIENSYKYGFILRYPKDKENITGYTYEPWHFRYLTIEIATILKEKNITYEEYIGMK